MLHFTLDPYLIMSNVKQGGIKYHFLKSFVWFDLGLNPISRSIGEHSTQNNLIYKYIKDNIFNLILFYFLRRKSTTTLAEEINISIRSKRKLYDDTRLVYKFTSLRRFHLQWKISYMFKLGWVNLQEHPFSGFLIFLTLHCFDPLYSRLRV